jgi:hypothetical protein
MNPPTLNIDAWIEHIDDSRARVWESCDEADAWRDAIRKGLTEYTATIRAGLEREAADLDARANQMALSDIKRQGYTGAAVSAYRYEAHVIRRTVSTVLPNVAPPGLSGGGWSKETIAALDTPQPTVPAPRKRCETCGSVDDVRACTIDDPNSEKLARHLCVKCRPGQQTSSELRPCPVPQEDRERWIREQAGLFGGALAWLLDAREHDAHHLAVLAESTVRRANDLEKRIAKLEERLDFKIEAHPWIGGGAK